MSAQHTPGPWAWVGKKLVAGKNQTHLLEMIEAPGMGRAAEPNRALIEAAPDMLAALEGMLSRYDGFGDVSLPVTGIWLNQIIAARAACAKAKGETA